MKEGNYTAIEQGGFWYATWFHDGRWRESQEVFMSDEDALDAAREAALSHSWVVGAFGGEVEIKELPLLSSPALPAPASEALHWWSTSDLILGWAFPCEFPKLMGALHQIAAKRPELSIAGFVVDDTRVYAVRRDDSKELVAWVDETLQDHAEGT